MGGVPYSLELAAAQSRIELWKAIVSWKLRGKKHETYTETQKEEQSTRIHKHITSGGKEEQDQGIHPLLDDKEGSRGTTVDLPAKKPMTWHKSMT